MISEQEYVITSFRKHFQRFQDKGIVVYGLGKNTEVLLDALRDEYHFIGLMDGVRTGETVYGLPVLTVDEAQERGVGVILILARAANLSIIYPRIAADCERYGIPVYDINGVEQHRITQKTYACPVFYATHTREALIEKMRAADVVSFDVFDTLLMRRCLEPTDVFFLVEQEAHRRGLLSQSVPFAKPRILAERALYPGQPTLDDIYARLMQDTGIAEDVAKELRALELAEEERQLVPRTAMMRLLHEAQAMGKTVIVTSDMYLGGQAIGRLLLMHGITGLDHVFVSSDTGVSKTGGLFDLVRQTYPGQHILHIGDNATSDVHAALSSGCDAWLVPSARQMLAESACAPLTEHSRDLPERVILGNFLTRELHDPFLFEKTQGRLRLADAYALGRDYAGPMVAGFVQWLIERCRADGIEMLLLGARDGWLIREILDDAARTMDLPFRYRYVYVSRAACTPAGVEDETDVLYAAGLAWDGTQEALLKNRFHLAEDDIRPMEDGESKEHYIRRHIPVILRRRETLRKHYLHYLESEGIRPGIKLGFFDFVSSGTCQLWLEKILGQPLHGYYFLRIQDPYKEKLSIQTYYEGTQVVYQTAKCHLMDNYFFMENIISSPETTLESVGKDGLHFLPETRTTENVRDLLAIQQGIRDTANDLIEVPHRPKLADELLNLVRHETCDVELDYLRKGVLEDEFCHRKFDLNEML